MSSQRFFIFSTSVCQRVATMAAMTSVICLWNARQCATAAEFYHLPSFSVKADSNDSLSVLVGAGSDDAIWKPQTGGITPLPSASYFNLSGDGSTVVGHRNANGNWAAVRWTPSIGLVDLPIPNPGDSRANAASADGSIIYGFMGKPDGSDSTMFRWTADSVVTDLGILEGNTQIASPWQTADDGSVVAGSQVRPLYQGFRWSSDIGMTSIGSVDGFEQTVAWDISADGTTIVGHTRRPDSSALENVGIRWSEQSGLVSLGSFMGWSTVAETVSADGKLLLGEAWPSDKSDKTLFAWTESLGMIDIEPLLNEQVGLSFFWEGNQRVQIKGLSNDGRTLVGDGAIRRNGQLLEGAWVVVLDRPIDSYLVPEPTTAALTLLALISVAALRRKTSPAEQTDGRLGPNS